jgi:DNA polymerase elongation subunit (family B)
LKGIDLHFYTNCFQYNNQIYYTGYDGKERVKRKVKYEPYVFLPRQSPGVDDEDFRTLEGNLVKRRTFSSISEANKFVREHKDISNFHIYGNTNFLYTWINDTFPGQMEYDSSLINVIFLDIEVESDKGLPDYKNAIHPITAITISKHGKKITFGCGEYEPKSANSAYIHCKNEKELLQKFLSVWNNPQYNPDILTGWNIEGFDIPYLYNRIKFLLGDDAAKKLSPWGIVEEREVQFRSYISGKTEFVYDLKGISVLDYFLLYKKFSFKNHESFSLNFIANAELGEKKTDYSEYESLLHLYRENYEMFIDYNIRDVELVEKLDDKLKLLELVFALAYDAKVTYADTLTTIRTWDTLIHNYLLDMCIVVPPMQKHKESELIGAYVKEPQLGMHKWVVSFDLTSLYPRMIMQYNISPETLRGKIDQEFSLDEVIDGKLSEIKHNLIEQDVCIAANLCTYRRDICGVLPAIMERVYKDRFNYKQKMIEAQKEYEQTKDPTLKKKIARYSFLQMAKKIQLNAGYGAVANPYFRFYNHDNAEAVTMTGQLVIRWIEIRLNRYLNKLLKTDKDYIIASDTDSLYVCFDDLVKSVGLADASSKKVVDFLDKTSQKLIPFIDACLDNLAEYTNVKQNLMIMKRENISEKGIWTAKKRYILNVWDSEGVRYEEPKLKIMGVESVRSSTPASCRDNIRKALSVIMNEDQAALIKFIEKFRAEFHTLPVDEIAFPRSISGLSKYKDSASIYAKSTPIQVKGALIYNHLISKKGLDKTYPVIYNNDKVKFVYLKTPNPLHEHVISFVNAIPKQFGVDDHIDYETQFQKGFLDPIRFISEAIGWQLEQTASLEEFM